VIDGKWRFEETRRCRTNKMYLRRKKGLPEKKMVMSVTMQAGKRAPESLTGVVKNSKIGI
jgi:hypothetical protein